MNTSKSSAFGLQEMLVVLAIVGLLFAIAITGSKVLNDQQKHMETYTRVSNNQELIKFSDSETGIVNRVFELPNTPTNQRSSIIEVILTNDKGRAYLKCAFPKDGQSLTNGESVLITVIEHIGPAGGSRVLFASKLSE